LLSFKTVEDAFKQWKLSMPYGLAGHPYRVYGELRFYFALKHGVGTVQNPSKEEQGVLSKKFRKVMAEEDYRLSHKHKTN
jgi:hypothetical protein